LKLTLLKNYIIVVVITSALMGCGGSSETNTPPIIETMTTGTVLERDSFSYTARAIDEDGVISSYQWQQISGTTVTLVEPNTSTLSFEAPNISEDETFSFTLTVIDENNGSTSADLNVNVSAYGEIELSTFTEPELAECIALDINADLGLEAINCDNYNIQTLSDLSLFSKLTEINITNANLENISTLEGLTQLTTLNVSNNEIRDTTAIEKLTSLTTLNLSQNRISDANNLSSLINLSSLNLESLYKNSSISINIENLTELEQLTSLTISGNYIYNTSELSEFSKLTTLNIANAGYEFNSLSFLSGLTGLVSLDLSGNSQITDLT